MDLWLSVGSEFPAAIQEPAAYFGTWSLDGCWRRLLWQWCRPEGIVNQIPVIFTIWFVLLYFIYVKDHNTVSIITWVLIK
jgi:hypothetical protein